MKLDNITHSSGARFSNSELKLIADELEPALTGGFITKEEINSLAHELEAKVPNRNFNSLQFVLNRLHILLSGKVPEGESVSRAEQMFSVPHRMKVFAKEYFGLEDADVQIQKAKEDLKKRPQPMKREKAKQIVVDFYLKNKDTIPPTVTKKRDEIIDLVMKGVPVEEAFDRVA